MSHPHLTNIKLTVLLAKGEEGGRVSIQLLAAILAQREAHIQLLQPGKVGLRAVKQSHSRSSSQLSMIFSNSLHCLSSVWGFPFSKYADLERLKKTSLLRARAGFFCTSFNSFPHFHSQSPAHIFTVFTCIAAFCHSFISCPCQFCVF